MTRGAVALLGALFALLFLAGLAARPLYKADESRYAEMAREMAASGDWVTPRLNDFKYFYKPPLQVWATAAFYRIFGESDMVARLWTGLCALATLLAVLHFGSRIFAPPAGAYGGLVLAGAPLFVVLGQFNTLDMGLTLFLSLAILAFAAGRHYLFWAACALAVLSKGLVGIVLPLAAIALYVLLRRDWPLLARMQPVKGPLLFLAIASPWFVAVSAANPEFAHFFFVQEHVQRFATRVHDRYAPPWYFVPVLLGGMAPWLLLAFSFRAPKLGRAAFDPAIFLLCWIAVVLVFFSASSSKLASYILPLFPALALLLGHWVALAQPRRLVTAQALLAAGAGIALAALALAAPKLIGLRAHPGYAPWFAAGGAILAVLAAAAAGLAWRGRLGSALASLALGSFVATLVVLAGHRTLAPQYSIGPQVAALERLPGAATRIYALDFYDHTLPWYFRRPVTMVAYRDELHRAVEWEPRKFVPDLGAFARAWAAETDAWAVLASPDFERLSAQFPMQAVSRGPRYTIVRKP